jgi:hypothetical protein
LRIKDVPTGLRANLVELLMPSNKKKWYAGTSLKAAAMEGDPVAKQSGDSSRIGAGNLASEMRQNQGKK